MVFDTYHIIYLLANFFYNICYLSFYENNFLKVGDVIEH